MAIRHIVVPVDFSERSETAVRYAVALAGRVRAAVTIVHAAGRETAEARAGLDQLSRFGDMDTAIIGGDDPAAQIVRFVTERHGDLVAIATRPRKREHDFYLGSVAMRVLESAPVPVICLRTDTSAEVPRERMLAAVDLEPRCLSVLRHAVELSADFGAILQVAHVALPDRAAVRRRLDEMMEAAGARPTHIEVLQADAAGLLTELSAASKTQLLVIGTRPHLRLSDLVLGSVAMRVIARAPCPVACVRTDRAP